MTNVERIDILEQSQELIREAMEMIERAVVGTDQESMTRAYTLAHLRNWVEGENPYDQTIPRLVEAFQKEDEGEGEGE